jgi:hypothetical protein
MSLVPLASKDWEGVSEKHQRLGEGDPRVNGVPGMHRMVPCSQTLLQARDIKAKVQSRKGTMK